MAKGGDFEREVSKHLTKWLSGKVKPYLFWRMPGSGGLATIHEENIDLSGDIRSLTEEAEFFTSIFSVEIKNGYPKTSFWQHFKKLKKFNIEVFWNQCVEDSKKGNKRPMLIYRKKSQKPLIGIDSNTDNKINEINEKLCKLPKLSMTFTSSLPTLVFYDFNDFFNIISPDVIKKLGKNING